MTFEYLDKENIYFRVKRRKTEKEKEENIWRIRYIFLLRRRKAEKEKGKTFGEGKYIFLSWRKTEKEKKEVI